MRRLRFCIGASRDFSLKLYAELPQGEQAALGCLTSRPKFNLNRCFGCAY